MRHEPKMQERLTRAGDDDRRHCGHPSTQSNAAGGVHGGAGARCRDGATEPVDGCGSVCIPQGCGRVGRCTWVAQRIRIPRRLCRDRGEYDLRSGLNAHTGGTKVWGDFHSYAL
jgi:hypothetical protein